MPKAKKTRKFAAVKRMISPKDERLSAAINRARAMRKRASDATALMYSVKYSQQIATRMNHSARLALLPLLSSCDSAHKAQQAASEKKKAKTFDGDVVRNIPKASTALFFRHNTSLGPPYQILIDTNFINFSITNKLDIFKAMMDCLLAKCIPILTDCVMAELEKLGTKYRVALRIAKDPRFQRLACTHTGTYADDCIVSRVTNHKCYMVATCDKDLKRRIRKIPGVPIMFITQHKYSIERFADVNDAPRQG